MLFLAYFLLALYPETLIFNGFHEVFFNVGVVQVTLLRGLFCDTRLVNDLGDVVMDFIVAFEDWIRLFGMEALGR